MQQWKYYFMGFYELIFETCGHLCHQRPERSFFIGKYQFPFCARCSGILFGVLIGFPFSLLVQFENFYLMVLLWIPMIIDGLTQKHTSYLSNNKRRFWKFKRYRPLCKIYMEFWKQWHRIFMGKRYWEYKVSSLQMFIRARC